MSFLICTFALYFTHSVLFFFVQYLFLVVYFFVYKHEALNGGGTVNDELEKIWEE
jgi:hypothetical protein